MQRSSWVVSAVGLAAFLAACSPDIQQIAQTPRVIIEFDPAASPPVVPQPNNLALDPATGLLNVPDGPTQTQTLFNHTYLNTLDGFPMESPASVTTSGNVSPSSLSTGVLVFDITNQAAAPSVVQGVQNSYAPNGPDAGGGGTIVITPPGGEWTRGHTYAVAIVGGTQTGAVTGATGQQVVGSSTWALITSSSNCATVQACGPLVPVCILPDGGPGGPSSGCLPVTDLIPSQGAAVQLQELQTGYAPLLAVLGGPPLLIPRGNVASLWTFSITTHPEVTFNPPNSLPFPNDALRTGPGGTVNIPIPAGTPATLAQLIDGLNHLNGFSTTATILSAVNLNLPNTGVSALMQGDIDPNSLTPQLAFGFVNTHLHTSKTLAQGDGGPNFTVCLSNVPPGCPSVTATLPNGTLKPQVFGIVPVTPLDELTTYAAYMTTSIKDTQGSSVIPSAAFALVRLPYATAPLALNGKSQVSLLTDDQANLLVQLQQAFTPLFSNLAGAGIPFQEITQLWAFSTQSTISQLQALAGLPSALPAAVFPGNPLWVFPVTSQVRAQLNALNIPNASIGAIWVGEIMDPFALTGPAGTFNPDGGVAAVPIPFIMTVPDGGVTGGGFPVTMFGHGLGGEKENAYAIANSLAIGGQAMIAIDEVWHGARNTCTGFGAYADAAKPGAGPLPDGGFPDFAICTTAATAPTDCNSVGRCQLHNRTTAACIYGSATADETCFLASQNECAPDNFCEGATDFNPAFSGWNLLNLGNLFATRDNFRQQVIDNTQFARVASGTGAGSLSALTEALNPNAINYSGQSLGGILGTLYTSVAFNVENAGLNVAGGNPVNILLTSPAFAPLLAGFQAGLAAEGIETNTPDYDLFITIARWILDPADPTNAAYFTAHKTGLPSVGGLPSIPDTRRTFVQWIVGDEVVPNPTTLQLIQAALRDPTANGLKVAGSGPFFGYQFNTTSIPFSFSNAQIPSCPGQSNRHAFLLRPPAATCGGASSGPGAVLTGDAQEQLVGFLAGAPPY